MAKITQSSKPDAEPNPRFSLKSFWYVYRHYSKIVGWRFYLFVAREIINSVIPIINTVLFGVIVTQAFEAVTTKNLSSFFATLLLVVGLTIFRTLFDELISFFIEKVDLDLEIYFGKIIIKKYLNVPLSVRESQIFADKFEEVKDLGSGVTMVLSSFINIIGDFASVIASVVALYIISPIIVLIITLAVVPYSIFSFKLSKKYLNIYLDTRKNRRTVWMILGRIFSSDAAVEIECNNLSEELTERVVNNSRADNVLKLRLRRKFLLPVMTSDLFGEIIGDLSLLIVAGKIVSGEIGVGQLLPIRMLINNLSANIRNIFHTVERFRDNIVKATSFMDFMAMPEQTSGEIVLRKTPKIEFKDVSFCYPTSKVDVLSGVNFVVNPGDSLAIVGENGAGKSTLLKLLIGAYQPTGGEILIDDHPFREINRASYLQQIGILMQDFVKFDFATLGENIWFGDVSKKYDEQAIAEVMELADAKNLPNTFKNGLNQLLSKTLDKNNATDLSGGQWQKVNIARAFFRSPNLLILDEPTSSIDAKSEAKIFNNIFKKQAGKSVVVVSHRFSTVRRANSIIVLEAGKIVEHGSHEQLMKRGGVYKEMFNLQAEWYQ